MIRSLPVLRRTALALLCAVALLPAGCASLGGEPGEDDRARLIRDMSGQLERGSALNFHAEYQLAGGKRGSISQQLKPHRVAYLYPGGHSVVSAKKQIVCNTTSRPAKCSQHVPGSESSSAVTDFAHITKHGLVVPQIVHELLRITEEQVSATVEQHDTTIAGLQATCLTVTGLIEVPVTDFVACVTSDGVLAVFTGLIGKKSIDQALVQVRSRPPGEVFTIPTGAKVSSQRSS